MAKRNKSSNSKKSTKKQAEKYIAANKKKISAIITVFVIILLIFAIAVYIVDPDFYKGLFHVDDTNTNISQGASEDITSGELSIHFLELGNKYTGDCTLIKVGDTEVLIDAGSRKGSATYIKEYVDDFCSDGILEYVIATHAHQDHIAAFVGEAKGSTRTGILYQYDVGTIIQFGKTNQSANSESGGLSLYGEYLQAVEQSHDKSESSAVYTASQCWYELDGAKKQYYLNDEKTISLNILYNYYYENTASNENDYSVCVMLSQELSDGKTNNYLFTGDLEKDGEKRLVENNDLPEVQLFKGAHHGSYTANTDALLEKIRPKHVAICCCVGTPEYTKNEENQFPAKAALDRIFKYTDSVYCTTLIKDYSKNEFTSMNGNIIFYYDKTAQELKLYCTNGTTKLKDSEWYKNNRA